MFFLCNASGENVFNCQRRIKPQLSGLVNPSPEIIFVRDTAVFRALFFGRKDLQPVAVRVRDKVDSHFEVFEHDAAHLLMQGVRGFIIIRSEGKVEFMSYFCG